MLRTINYITSNMTINKKWLCLWLVAMTVLFISTHIPQDDMPEHFNMLGFDKLTHVIAYSVVTILAFKAFLRSEYRLLSVMVMVSFGLASLGVLDELTQPLVGRVCGIDDWLADCVGITLAAIAFWFFLKPKS